MAQEDLHTGTSESAPPFNAVDLADDHLDILGNILEVIRTHDPKFAGRHKNEQVQTYYRRVVKQLNAVSDDAYNALPTAAKEWNDQAVVAFKASQPIPAIPGYDEGALPVKEAKPPKAVKPPKAPKIKAAPAPKPPKAPRPESVTIAFRRLVIDNPQASAKELIERLAAEHKEFGAPKPVTLNTIYSDTQSTLRLLREAGKFKE
jgi:hypothetical protein